MFDVIIPTKRRPNDLQNILQSIKIQTEKPNKVIIIDQSNEINKVYTSEYFEDAIDVLHLHKPFLTGLTDAKNFGLGFAEAEIIHFFDDDIILDRDYFEKINNHFREHPEYFGICGRQKNSVSSKFKILVFDIFHIGKFKDIRKKCNSGYCKSLLMETNILPGGLTAYRKSVFDDMSFDDTLIKYCLGEDMDFSFRLGAHQRLAFAMDATAIHNHSNIGRYDAIESYACKVASYSYFYKKNVDSSRFDKFSYCLVNIGIILDAIMYSIKYKTMEGFIGLKKGYYYLKSDFDNVPFIDKEKYDLRRRTWN